MNKAVGTYLETGRGKAASRNGKMMGMNLEDVNHLA